MPDNAINLYDTRRMLNMLEQMPPAPTFLRNRFFRNTRLHDTDTIDIDIVKGGRRVTPYIRPVQEGVVMERAGFKTNSYKMPYARIKRTSEADRHFTRSAGDHAYGNRTPAQRAATELADDLADLNANLDAEEERQAAEAIFTGKVTVRNAEGKAIHNIDFGLTNTEALTGAALWSASGATKNSVLKLLRAKRRSIVKTGAPSPNHIVVATDVSDVLINIFDPDDTASGLSSIRADRGQIDITNLPDGVTYIGYFNELGCDVYSYDGEYIDLDGSAKPYAPAGTIAMLSTNARFDRNYGAIKNFHGNFASVPRFPHSWITDDGRARFLQLESAPLYALHQVDSVAVVKVL